ncbi:MAG: hypothetical protein GY866_19000, partial [Proteobacteria bacterium]|nr:hypothetical protein [Pseudomonadota bacterium]
MTLRRIFRFLLALCCLGMFVSCNFLEREGDDPVPENSKDQSFVAISLSIKRGDDSSTATNATRRPAAIIGSYDSSLLGTWTAGGQTLLFTSNQIIQTFSTSYDDTSVECTVIYTYSITAGGTFTYTAQSVSCTTGDTVEISTDESYTINYAITYAEGTTTLLIYDTEGGSATYTRDSALTAASMIVALPGTFSPFKDYFELQGTFSKDLLASDNTVSLFVPLDVPIRLMELVFYMDGDPSLVGILNAKPSPASLRISEPFTIDASTDEKTVTINSLPLGGTWIDTSQNCIQNTSTGIFERTSVTFSENSYAFTAKMQGYIYGSPLYTFQQSGVYMLGNDLSTSMGSAREFDFTISQQLFTPHSNSQVTNLNTVGYCGHSSWQKDVPKDVTNCDTYNGQAGSFFTIVKMDSGTLTVEEPATDSANRPTSFSESDTYEQGSNIAACSGGTRDEFGIYSGLIFEFGFETMTPSEPGIYTIGSTSGFEAVDFQNEDTPYNLHAYGGTVTVTSVSPNFEGSFDLSSFAQDHGGTPNLSGSVSGSFSVPADGVSRGTFTAQGTVAGYTIDIDDSNAVLSQRISGGGSGGTVTDYGGTWSNGSSMSTARAWSASTVHEGDIYVLGGSGATNLIERYSISGNGWDAPFGPMNSSVEGSRIRAVSNNMYVFIFREDGNVAMWNPSGGYWYDGGSMQACQRMGKPVIYNDKIYIFGCYDSSASIPLNRTIKYCSSTATEDEPIAPMPTARYATSAVVYGGKIYVIGGGLGTSGQAVLEVYDPATDTWETKAPAPVTDYGWGVAGVVGDRIYFVANDTTNLGNPVAVYLVAQDQWGTGTAMPSGRSYMTGEVVGDRLYVVGGQFMGSSGSETSILEIFDPSSSSS